jgi:hypothetical protein
MDVQIRWKDVPRSRAVEDYLAWRLRFEVGRLADGVTAVRVRFEDVNGLRGWVDKSCAIELEGAFGRLSAAAYEGDFYVASNQAAKAIGSSLATRGRVAKRVLPAADMERRRA